MKKKFVFVTFLGFFSNLAYSKSFHLFEALQNKSHKIEQSILKKLPTEDYVLDLKELMRMGWEVFRLYSSKYPECETQYQYFSVHEDKISQLDSVSLKKNFHNGDILPQAPIHCYFARTVLVHSALGFAKLREVLTDESRASAAHDFEEIQEHLPNIIKKLAWKSQI